MIARIWRASATAEGADRYREHFTGSVLPELSRCDGFVDASLLEKAGAERTDLQVITRWESLAKIEAFAGADLTIAVVEPAAQAALLDYDRTVEHYTITATHQSD
jgi:heme-degrading monooxygenase HmoA